MRRRVKLSYGPIHPSFFPSAHCRRRGGVWARAACVCVSCKHAHTITMQPTPHTTAARSLAAAVLWATLSATAVLLNKTLLSGAYPFPLTLAFSHMGACWVTATVAVHTGVAGPRPPPVALRSVALVGALFAASLALSDAAFAAGLSVSGAQALKAATSPCVYALSVAAALDAWTPRRGLAVLTILVGVAIASTGEATVAASTLTSVALQAGAVAAEAARLVLMQTLLSPRSGLTPLTTLHAVARRARPRWRRRGPFSRHTAWRQLSQTAPSPCLPPLWPPAVRWRSPSTSLPPC